MATVLFIALSVLWLSVGALFQLLERQRPWHRISTGRARVQMLRSLEERRHGVLLLYWVYSLGMVVELAHYAKAVHLPVLLWVVIMAVLGEVIVRQEAVQNQVFTWLLKFSGSYGRYLRFVGTTLQWLEPLGKWLMPEQPYFRNRQELTGLVQQQHRTHKILSNVQQRQLTILLEIDTTDIATKIIPLKKALMVKAEEVTGPLLLSELHESDYGSFAVYDKRRTKIIGVLDQGVAVSHAAHSAKVTDLMEERVVYLPHNATYQQALQTFIETSSPISVIIDGENQPVGVLYVQDILRDLFERSEPESTL